MARVLARAHHAIIIILTGNFHFQLAKNDNFEPYYIILAHFGSFGRTLFQNMNNFKNLAKALPMALYILMESSLYTN